jgi:hypothetical protein
MTPNLNENRDELIKEFTDENDGNSMLDFLYASDEYWFNNTDIDELKRYILDKQQDEYVEIGYQSDGNSVEDIFRERWEQHDDNELEIVLQKFYMHNDKRRLENNRNPFKFEEL